MERIVAHLDDGWKRHAAPAWLEGWSPREIALEGGTADLIEMGSGPTLVLIPPLPGYKEAWVACAAPLARRFRVITFDLRRRFRGAPSWDALLDDVDRILAGVDGPLGLVGHSMGGALAQRWALRRPERVGALVLSSAFARVVTPRGLVWSRFVEQPFVLAGQKLLPAGLALAIARPLARREAWVYDRRCDDTVLDFVRFCIRETPLGLVRTALALVMAHDTRAALPALAAPTLIVRGERETEFVALAAAELVRLIAGAEVAISPGVSHLHPLSSPAWLVERITAWMTPRLGPAR